MFIHVQKSGKFKYVTLRESFVKDGKHLYRVVKRLGKLDQLEAENKNALQELKEKNVSAEEKLMFFLDAFILNAWQKECWQVKVWARELINPSPFITHILSNSAIPKLNIVVKIFSEYTGIPKMIQNFIVAS